MANKVQFGRGGKDLQEAAALKTDMVFFNTDENTITIGTKQFGFSATDKATLASIKTEVDRFFKNIDQDSKIIDTLSEIVALLSSGEGENAKDILTLIAEAAKAASDAQADADALEKALGTGFSEDSTVASQLSAVKSTADSAIQTISEGTAEGTISVVDGTAAAVNVKVNGLKSAAYQESSAFDAAGTASQAAAGALSEAKSYTDEALDWWEGDEE
jgi:hypothetical protein